MNNGLKKTISTALGKIITKEELGAVTCLLGLSLIFGGTTLSFQKLYRTSEVRVYNDELFAMAAPKAKSDSDSAREVLVRATEDSDINPYYREQKLILVDGPASKIKPLCKKLGDAVILEDISFRDAGKEFRVLLKSPDDITQQRVAPYMKNDGTAWAMLFGGVATLPFSVGPVLLAVRKGKRNHGAVVSLI